MLKVLLVRVLRLLASAGLPVLLLVLCRRIPHVNATTSGLLLVLLIIGIAGCWGGAEALSGAIAGGIGFDYFFLPQRPFAVENLEDLTALGAFLLTAISSGWLFARARQRQIRAQRKRDEIYKLYRLGNAAMEGSEAAPTAQRLADCVREIFALDSVVLWDACSGEIFRSGTLAAGLPDPAIRELGERANPLEELSAGFVFTPLYNGNHVSGSMGIHGANLSPQLLTLAAGRVGIGLAKLYSIARATEAEAARRSEELKSAVLDALAHEIRSPLNSIKIAVSALLSQPPAKQSTERELLTIIEEESDRLDALIDDAMETSRLEAGNLELHRKSEDMHQLLEDAREEMKSRSARHHVQISVPDSLSPVTCDSRMMRKALKLLLDNALKYSPAGSTIVLSARFEDGMAILSVANNGPAIPFHEWDRIFEKHYRGFAGRSHGPGTGLGLPSAKSIVEAHGGHIWVTTPPGGGAEFHMALPLAERKFRCAAQV